MEATSVAFYATIYLAIPTQSFAFRPSPSSSPHVPVAPPVRSRSVVTAAPACPNICELTDLLIGTPELSPSTNTLRVSAHMDKNSEDVTLRRPTRPPSPPCSYLLEPRAMSAIIPGELSARTYAALLTFPF